MLARSVALSTALALVAACSDVLIRDKQQRQDERAGATAVDSDIIQGQWVIELSPGIAEKTQAMSAILKAANATLKSDHLDIARAFVAYMTDSAARLIRGDPRIRSLVPNRRVHLASVQTPAPWALDRIDQRNRPGDGAFTYGRTGAGTHIYFVDTGILTQHTQFMGRATGDYTSAGDNLGTTDGLGHGTAVASAAAGNGYGVAKLARIHAVKVVDVYGYGDVSSVVAGLDWIRLNHIKPAVVNISVGFKSVFSAVDNAVQSVTNAGVPVVVAAGNDSQDACTRSPSSAPSAISVVSVDSFDVRTAWSNVGSCTTFYAPGMGVRTAWYDYRNFPTRYSDSALVSGTSVSSPLAAGVAAIYLEQNPAATPAAVKSALVADATPNVVQAPGTGTPNLLLYAVYRAVPSLSVSITGPSGVPSRMACSWSAAPNGGAGPYSYQWQVDYVNVGTDPDLIYENSGSAFSLRLTITDQYFQTASSTRSIAVGSMYPMCRY